MPKKKSKVTLEEKIMLQIKHNKIKMKPKWYFLAGSVLLFVSLVILSVGVMFLFNLMFFALRAQGPMASWRISMILSNFPWWRFLLALLGLVAGVKLMKKYDFSYKKNFALVMVVFVLTVIIAGFLFDKMGFNEKLIKRGPMIRFYQGFERGSRSGHPSLCKLRGGAVECIDE